MKRIVCDGLIHADDDEGQIRNTIKIRLYCHCYNSSLIFDFNGLLNGMGKLHGNDKW